MNVLIFCLVLGGIFVCMGWWIWKKQRIDMIHSYHYKKVAEKDKKAYTEQVGKSILIMGAGIMGTGVINWMTGTEWGWICFGIGFIIMSIKLHQAQKKYNGSWF